MTRYLTSAILFGGLALPAAALAQHSQGAGTPSVGTATSSAPASAPAPAPTSSGTSTSGSSPRTYDAGGGGEPNSAGHSRGNLPSNGTAVRRGAGGGGGGGGGTIIIEGSGFYPWGWAYGGAAGAYGGYYGGYYGAYDPWYGWFPTYAPSAYGSDNSGALRLKVKPSDASVYVDGFYVGVVDDFDGVFQKLRVDPGPHRIEIRGQEYRTLSVDVMIQEDLTITYRGELAKQ